MGVEILTPGANAGAPGASQPAPSSTPTPATTAACKAVGPVNATPLPAAEKPADAPEAVNDISPTSRSLLAQAPNANGKKNPKPEFDKSDESSSKHKKKKGLVQTQPLLTLTSRPQTKRMQPSGCIPFFSILLAVSTHLIKTSSELPKLRQNQRPSPNTRHNQRRQQKQHQHRQQPEKHRPHRHPCVPVHHSASRDTRQMPAQHIRAPRERLVRLINRIAAQHHRIPADPRLRIDHRIAPNHRGAPLNSAHSHSGSQTAQTHAPSHRPPPAPSRRGRSRYAPAVPRQQRYPPRNKSDFPAPAPKRRPSESIDIKPNYETAHMQFLCPQSPITS